LATKDKATEAAQKKAEEAGVDVAKVEGTGADGAVTVRDVEEKAAEPEKRFRVKLNPALGQSLDLVEVGGRIFRGGEAVSEREFEALKEAKDPYSGVQLLLKGKEVA
jgi:pyruvate/2-oxoglutarate dehydrogenase complex dihydrolipoamide acyltransferase (E2) component